MTDPVVRVLMGLAPPDGSVNSPADQDTIRHRLRRFPNLTDNQINLLAEILDPVLVEQVSDAWLASLVAGTLPGQPLNPDGGLALGLPGATAACRWVGATVSGAPVSGAFHVGDFIITHDGHVFVCIEAGAPGTWVDQSLVEALAAAPDASVSTKGLVKLAGDLAGTALSPTVPGLATKADAAATTTALAGKADATTTSTALGTKQPYGVPTAVKTAAYTAVGNDLIPVDTTSGPVTITLPAAPADKTRVIVKHVVQGGTNAVTISRGGSTDVFNKAGGSTSLTLSTPNQSMTLQYQSSVGIWYVVDDSLTPTAVVALGSGTFAPLASPALTGTPTVNGIPVVVRAPAASGGNDSTALAAVIAAAASGSKIEFDPSNGPYLLSSGLTWAKPLVLDLRGATFKANTTNLHEWIVVNSGGDGTQILNGIFDSNVTGRTTMHFSNCADITVDNNRFINKTANVLADTAIKLSACTDVEITRNRFKNWGYAGANVSTNLNRCIGTDTSCADITIHDNTASNVCRLADVVGRGYTITDNKIRHTFDNGLYLTASDTAGQFWSDVVITGNRFYDVEEGIVLAGSNEATTEWCERVKIADNVFHDWLITAIDWDHRIRDVDIVDNIFAADATIVGTALGLRSSHQSATATTRNLKIAGNRFRGTHSYAPIWLQNPEGSCSISDNDFDITFSVNNLPFVKIDSTCDGMSIGQNNFVNTGTATGTKGIWSKATATNCSVGNNSYVNVAVPFAYGVSATAGIPSGWTNTSSLLPLRRIFFAVDDSSSNTNWNSPGTISSRYFAVRNISTGAQNASITFTDNFPAGTYSIITYYGTGTDRGIMSVDVNGTVVGTIDTYSASAAGARTKISGVTALSITGPNSITITMTDKNASSSSYFGELSALTLIRTGS